MNAPKRVLPPIYFLISLIVMVGLNFFFPLIKIVQHPYSYIGGVLIVIGTIMNLWASGYFFKVNTTIKPFQRSTHLVTVGLYQYTRNPMYLGGIFMLLGVALLLGSLTPFLVIPVFMWLIQEHFIKVEESGLEETFKDEYLEYKKQVRRWI